MTSELLPAVELLLAEESYPELSVERIVSAAGLSRSTFYNYFQDKSDLLRALTDDVMSQVVGATGRWLALPPDCTRQDLEDALRHLVAVYRPHQRLMRAVADSTSHDEALHVEFMAYIDRGRRGIAAHIHHGQQAGRFRPGLDPSAAAAWLTWMFEHGLSQVPETAGDAERERYVSAASHLVWKALR